MHKIRISHNTHFVHNVDEIVTIGEIAFPNRIHLFDDDTLKKICNEGLRFY